MGLYILKHVHKLIASKGSGNVLVMHQDKSKTLQYTYLIVLIFILSDSLQNCLVQSLLPMINAGLVQRDCVQQSISPDINQYIQHLIMLR